jgi:hypothetical protein
LENSRDDLDRLPSLEEVFGQDLGDPIERVDPRGRPVEEGPAGRQPARSSACLSLMQRVAYGSALILAFSIGLPHRSHSPYVP